MKVIFSHPSNNDLNDIVDHIAEDSLSRALSFTQKLKERCNSLDIFPTRNPIHITLDSGAEVRKYPYKDYIIYYLIEDENVIILRIQNAAKRPPF